MEKHIFIIGAKSMGAYGGFDTFVNNLTKSHEDNENIRYHVAVKANGKGSKIPEELLVVQDGYICHNAECIKISVPAKLGPIQGIYYDYHTEKKVVNIIKREGIEKPVIYILACKIGPFFEGFVSKIHKLGGKVYVNPDGLEWNRGNWSKPVKSYLKYSTKKMVEACDLVVCDSKNIEKYIKENYNAKETTFIAYGAYTEPSKCGEDKYNSWLESKGLKKDNYYLIVGRFVPENNYYTMIKEFMKTNIKKDLAIITNSNEKLFNELETSLHFSSDPRIKFVGTVYDQELLKKIREDAYGYIHGHEVGGTNPSLLESLGSTNLNLLFNVGFNEEVARDSALYWNKEDGNLARLIESCETIDREPLGVKAKKRINDEYTWEHVADKYEKIWFK